MTEPLDLVLTFDQANPATGHFGHNRIILGGVG